MIGQLFELSERPSYAKSFTLLISKMYLIRVLSFIGNVRFNVRGEHVPGCLGRG